MFLGRGIGRGRNTVRRFTAKRNQSTGADLDLKRFYTHSQSKSKEDLKDVQGPRGEHSFVMRQDTPVPFDFSTVRRIEHFDIDPDASNPALLAQSYDALYKHDRGFSALVDGVNEPINRNLRKIHLAQQKGWTEDRPGQIDDYINHKKTIITDRGDFLSSDGNLKRGEMVATKEAKKRLQLDDIVPEKVLQVRTEGQSFERVAETQKHETSHLFDWTQGFDLSDSLALYGSEVNAFNDARSFSVRPGRTETGTLFYGGVQPHYQQALNVSDDEAKRIKKVDGRVTTRDIEMMRMKGGKPDVK